MPLYNPVRAYTANSTCQGCMATESPNDSYVYYLVFIIGGSGNILRA